MGWFDTSAKRSLALTLAFASGCAAGEPQPGVQLAEVHDNGLFELDQDGVDDPPGGADDWDAVLLGGGGGSFADTGVIVDAPGATAFTGGGSKDDLDITSWRHSGEDPQNVPPKDDIRNAYAAAYNLGGDLIIYFGADKAVSEGSAQLGFWFFQDQVEPLPDGTFDGVHTIGDILVLANFAGGGDDVTISVLRWVGTGGDIGPNNTLQTLFTASGATCGPALSGDDACAITNAAQLNTDPGDLDIPWRTGVLDIHTFFEGGINLTDILADAGVTNPPCFASFLAETRASPRERATLKDFVVDSFPVCSISITKECTDSDLNPDPMGEPFLYTYEGTVTNTGQGTLYDVTVTDDNGTPGVPGDDTTHAIGTLAGGASAPYGGTFDSAENPETNIASVTAAISPGGDPIVTDTSDPAVCPGVEISPVIDVTKVCTPRLEDRGDEIVVVIDFEGQVCNQTSPGSPGEIGLENVIVTDDNGTADTADDQVIMIGTLDPGECKPYSDNYTPNATSSTDPALATFSDTVTAEGDGLFGFGHVEDMATAQCSLCPPANGT